MPFSSTKGKEKIMPKDYYIVLGVTRGANLNKIKKAYRTVVKKYHPDVVQSEETKKRFLEVREAYETLIDEGKRKEYDKTLARQESELKIKTVPDMIERRTSLFDQMESRFFSATDDFFEGFLPGFFDIDKARIRGKDLYFEAILSPGEAAKGGLFPVTVPVIEPCPRCSKTGFWEDFVCPTCSGTGRVHSERGFSISIPPNVANGTEIRLSLEDIGLPEVYVNITVLIDPHMEEEDW
jgi:molecular chaperone DnaJ